MCTGKLFLGIRQLNYYEGMFEDWPPAIFQGKVGKGRLGNGINLGPLRALISLLSLHLAVCTKYQSLLYHVVSHCVVVTCSICNIWLLSTGVPGTVT